MNEENNNEETINQEGNQENSQEGLSKAERKRLKRERRAAEKEKEIKVYAREQKKKSRKKIFIIAVIIVLILVGAYLIFQFGDFEPIDETEIISRSGIHWHPQMQIYIYDKPQTIPAGLGLTGRRHGSMHTHDRTGELHLETDGIVRQDDISVKEFFKIWGQQFNSECILDSCNGPDGQVHMLVNGQESFEFENYLMKDRDFIEIRYE